MEAGLLGQIPMSLYVDHDERMVCRWPGPVSTKYSREEPRQIHTFVDACLQESQVS